jgi:hypothetical protein
MTSWVAARCIPSASPQSPSGLLQAGEPTLVQAFIPQSSIEALRTGILIRFPGLDQLQGHALFR